MLDYLSCEMVPNIMLNDMYIAHTYIYKIMYNIPKGVCSALRRAYFLAKSSYPSSESVLYDLFVFLQSLIMVWTQELTKVWSS